MMPGISRHLQQSLGTLPEGALTLLLIGIGLVYIGIGIFSHNLMVKAAAAAYGLLP